ncbi:hypothetical protein V2G26_008352 [Clonostachys chloroleuca]
MAGCLFPAGCGGSERGDTFKDPRAGQGEGGGRRLLFRNCLFACAASNGVPQSKKQLSQLDLFVLTRPSASWRVQRACSCWNHRIRYLEHIPSSSPVAGGRGR